MRVGWVSAPVTATTGYGKVSREVCSRLADMGYDMVNIGGRGSTVVYGEKIEIVTEKGGHVLVLPTWGQAGDRKTIEYYIHKYDLKCIVSLWDAFALWQEKLSRKLAAYVPIDAAITGKWANYMVRVDMVVAMSKFGEKQLLSRFPEFMVKYIPHGVDLQTYKPRKDKDEIRTKWHIPKDKFMVLFVGANYGERKCIPQLMVAFKNFLKSFPDSVLYLCCSLVEYFPQGYDLAYFADELGIADKVMGPIFNMSLDSFEDSEMAELYACADVLILPSMGEGFGLPLIEAQACGTPVITTNTSSNRELVEGHGWLIDTVPSSQWMDIPVWIPLLAQYEVPRIDSITKMLLVAAKNPSVREEFGKKSREFAEKFAWEKIMPSWDALLKELVNLP